METQTPTTPAAVAPAAPATPAPALTLFDRMLAELHKIPINITTADKAIELMNHFGLLPPGLGFGLEEAVNLAGSLFTGLKAVGAITDEATANVDMRALLTEIDASEAVADAAIAGEDPQDPLPPAVDPNAPPATPDTTDTP